MKLTLAQLKPHLAKQMASIYLVSGEEVLLKEDALTLIRQTAKNAGFCERSRLAPEAGFDWEQLYNELHATSLFAQKRLVELHFHETSPPKAATMVLAEFAENPNPDVLLIIEIAKADARTLKSAWYQRILKTGVHLTLWPIGREQLSKWILQRAQQQQLKLTTDAANLLANLTEGNLIATSQTLEKLALLAPKETVDEKLLATFLQDESQFSVFDFVATLIGGDKPHALHVLKKLEQEGMEPTLILWSVTRELRLLYDMLTAHQNGASWDQLFQKHRIFYQRQVNFRHFLTNHNLSDCQQLLKQAATIDKMIKGACSGKVFQAFELFCLRL